LTYRIDDEAEWHTMGSRRLAIEVVDHDDLVSLRNSIQLLLRNFFSEQLSIVRDIPDHLIARILVLAFPVLADLEHTDLVRSIGSEFYTLGELVAEVINIDRPGQQERVRRLLLVVDARPDDLERSLRLKFRNGYIEELV
jgi:hypothetical protein